MMGFVIAAIGIPVAGFLLFCALIYWGILNGDAL